MKLRFDFTKTDNTIMSSNVVDIPTGGNAVYYSVELTQLETYDPSSVLSLYEKPGYYIDIFPLIMPDAVIDTKIDITQSPIIISFGGNQIQCISANICYNGSYVVCKYEKLSDSTLQFYYTNSYDNITISFSPLYNGAIINGYAYEIS